MTLITHGFDGNVTDWIIPMASRIPLYPGFPGTNFTCYEISITQNTQGQYVASETLLAGGSPVSTDSGEIIIKLDWSTLSGGGTPTTTIAATAAAALLNTNFIPELNGRPLAELPLHLIGHSRGGSVITEMARVLGAEGVWVDHVTTLDPHPVSFFGDPAIKNYANILYADNYWQNLGNGLTDPTGQAVSGAYNRQLTNLSGGYSSYHSDVHLWYHGTIDYTVPLTVDSATISSSERSNWWTLAEAAGTNAGFRWSLLGASNRFSSFEPAGAGKGRISDGYNRMWDFGAGLSANRSALAVDDGAWPNLLRLDVTSTNTIAAGGAISFRFYHQFGSSTSVTATVRFYLDPDLNPYDGNEVLLYNGPLAGTGTTNVLVTTIAANTGTSLLPGGYWLAGQVTDGTRTRYLYAPEKLTIQQTSGPLLLSSPAFSGNAFRFTILGTTGQRFVVQVSSNLADWSGVQTNVLTNAMEVFTDPAGGTSAQKYYRLLQLP